MQKEDLKSCLMDNLANIQEKYGIQRNRQMSIKDITLAKYIIEKSTRNKLTEQVKAHPILSLSFSKADKPQIYLSLPNFRGRALLTKLRTNDKYAEGAALALAPLSMSMTASIS